MAPFRATVPVASVTGFTGQYPGESSRPALCSLSSQSPPGPRLPHLQSGSSSIAARSRLSETWDKFPKPPFRRAVRLSGGTTHGSVPQRKVAQKSLPGHDAHYYPCDGLQLDHSGRTRGWADVIVFILRGACLSLRVNPTVSEVTNVTEAGRSPENGLSGRICPSAT